MSQYSTDTESNALTLLREIMRLIARNSSLDEVAPQILKSCLNVSGAEAAFYVVLQEPYFQYGENLSLEQFPSERALQALFKHLQNEPEISSDLPDFLSQFSSWAIFPYHDSGTTVSVMGLLYSGSIDLSDQIADMLLSLVDALIAVTRGEIADARHQKLTNNQNEFVRIVSHDLRSPLTSIQGFASMLESQMVGELNERQQHFVEKILSGVAQMTSLVDNIQDAGRYDPETGFYEMERAPTDINAIINRIVTNHLLPAEKLNLSLKCHLYDNVPIVNVDASMLERSIINLVDNAIKYTPDGGLIEVGAQRVGDDIVISVRDNGYGISPENLESLFQRHFRIRRQEHKKVKGSGLGLFIVRSVAFRHGGDAWVESLEGQGSTFFIRIPLQGKNLMGSSSNNDHTSFDA